MAFIGFVHSQFARLRLAVGDQIGRPLQHVASEYVTIGGFQPVVAVLVSAGVGGEHAHAVGAVFVWQAGERSKFARKRGFDLPVDVAIEQHEQYRQRDHEHASLQQRSAQGEAHGRRACELTQMSKHQTSSPRR
jgi:hypothetical protein